MKNVQVISGEGCEGRCSKGKLVSRHRELFINKITPANINKSNHIHVRTEAVSQEVTGVYHSCFVCKTAHPGTNPCCLDFNSTAAARAAVSEPWCCPFQTLSQSWTSLGSCLQWLSAEVLLPEETLFLLKELFRKCWLYISAEMRSWQHGFS